jgi:hypothetical protein
MVIGDLLAITVDEPPLLVQATSLANVSARVAKASACPALAIWLRHGKFQVFGWVQRAGRWCVKIVEVKGEHLVPEVLSRPPRRSRDRHKQADLFTDIP